MKTIKNDHPLRRNGYGATTRSWLQHQCFAFCDSAAGIRVRLMRKADLLVVATILLVITPAVGHAQAPSQRNPDVSNKALITKSTPGISTEAFKNQSANRADVLRKMADDYYAWRNENYPVRSSDVGLHTWDDRLTDYSPAKIAERAQHVHSLLEKVRAMKTDNWPKNDRIDWILFRAQLENIDFGDRVLKFEQDKSAGLHPGMHGRDLFAAEKGIRHTEKSALLLPLRVSNKCLRC